MSKSAGVDEDLFIAFDYKLDVYDLLFRFAVTLKMWRGPHFSAILASPWLTRCLKYFMSINLKFAGAQHVEIGSVYAFGYEGNVNVRLFVKNSASV